MECAWCVTTYDQRRSTSRRRSSPLAKRATRSAWRLLWHDHRLLAGNGVERGPVDVHVGHDQLRRRMREPFRERKILVDPGFEHLQKFQIGVAGVFDVVRQGFLD